MYIPKQQNGTFWIDESGVEIPANRVTKAEKLREKKANQLARSAARLSAELSAFKTIVNTACKEVVDAIRTENHVKPDGKGNVTWHNFDRSIKIEVNVNEAIRFDETLIAAAQEKLNEVLSETVTGDEAEFLKSVATDAFQTSSGKLDTTKVLSLKKHGKRIKSNKLREGWESAMALIDSSITRPSSKKYTRIWVKDTSGEYKNIVLDFSGVQPS